MSPSSSVRSLYLVYSCVCLLSFHLIIAYHVPFVSSTGFVLSCEVSHVSVCLPFCLSVYFDFVLLPLSRYSWFVSAVSPAVSTCPNHLPILSHSPFVPCWNLKLLKFPSCFSVFSGLSIFATLGSSQFMFVVFLLYFMFSLSLYPSHQKGKKTKQKNLQKKIKITSNVVKENTSKTQSKMYHFLSFDKKLTNQKSITLNWRNVFLTFCAIKQSNYPSIFRFPFSLVLLTFIFVSFSLFSLSFPVSSLFPLIFPF